MQPTDPSSVVGFRVFRTRLPGRRSSREPCLKHQGLVVRTGGRINTMKTRIASLAMTLAAIAVTVLAGGASVRGF